MHHLYKHYHNFAEWVDLPIGGVASGRVCAYSIIMKQKLYIFQKLKGKNMRNRSHPGEGLEELPKLLIVGFNYGNAMVAIKNTPW